MEPVKQYLAGEKQHHVPEKIQKQNRYGTAFTIHTKLYGFRRILYPKSNWLGAEKICKNKHRMGKKICCEKSAPALSKKEALKHYR
jgi:hypothetical protein